MIIAGKDRIVSNTGAQAFYRNTATPPDKKTLKQFFNSYHQIHKEEHLKPEFYETIYKYVNKTLK
jgi:hypothetical protein